MADSTPVPDGGSLCRDRKEKRSARKRSKQLKRRDLQSIMKMWRTQVHMSMSPLCASRKDEWYRVKLAAVLPKVYVLLPVECPVYEACSSNPIPEKEPYFCFSTRSACRAAEQELQKESGTGVEYVTREMPTLTVCPLLLLVLDRYPHTTIEA